MSGKIIHQMRETILSDLVQKGLIAPEDAEKIAVFSVRQPFSLHWELKTLLYLGVVLLNVGLGFIIYENIDTIGHAAIIALIGAVSAGCFWYAIRHRRPFSLGEVESPTPYYDYILLLGCLTFLLMEGYWQFQYQIFGTRYGLATLIPMVLFFIVAYRFDNRGVLTMAITALASWLGVTVTTNELLIKNDFNSSTIVNTGIFLGALLMAITFAGERFKVKKHFSLTYLNFGVHILMVACLAGMMILELPLFYFPLLVLAVGFCIWYARKNDSFYFLLLALLYGYIGGTYLIFRLLPDFDITFYFLYFIISCIMIIVFLRNYKQFLKTDAP